MRVCSSYRCVDQGFRLVDANTCCSLHTQRASTTRIHNAHRHRTANRQYYHCHHRSESVMGSMRQSQWALTALSML
jgi:hypothetical protein